MECGLSVKLNTINLVKEYIDIVSKSTCEISILCGKFLLDGKSFMSLFSMDLTKPIELVIRSDSEENVLNLCENLNEFCIL